MVAWVVTPAGKSLLAEMDQAFPRRDRRSDGTIGNDVHSVISSDHNPDETGKTPYEDSDSINEVHADDIDSDLNRPGWTLARCFEIIRKRSAAGLEKRVQNMIVDGRITSRSWSFDSWRPYGGTDPHDTHGHVSLRYGSGSGQDNPENITTPWGILAAVQAEIAAEAKAREDQDMAFEPADVWTDVYYGRDAERRSTGQLLVETRTAVLALVGEVKALRAEVDDLKGGSGVAG